jgi:CRISPR-associated exonuclease Cas4
MACLAGSGTRGLGCHIGRTSLVVRLAWGVACAVAVVARWRSLENHAARAERASRPAALRDAELVYLEKLFRISTSVGLVAKLDRAYRLPSGLLVLVEFKTRWSNQPCLSDVIQLSAQRMVVIGQTGPAVASYGYVMMKAPTRRSLPFAHRVQLMTHEEMVALVRRREDVLTGQVLPLGPLSYQMCLTCAFRMECDRLFP